MPDGSGSTARLVESIETGGAPGRSVHIEEESGLFRIVSEDGEVGGVFVSKALARRFAEREFRVAQGRDVVDDTERPSRSDGC